MCLIKTSLKQRRIKLDKWEKSLQNLEGGWEGDVASFMKERHLAPTPFDTTHLGTIGGGNHFAELQQIEQVFDPEQLKKLQMDEESLYLLVHSGSRAYGESILSKHLDQFGTKGLKEVSSFFSF